MMPCSDIERNVSHAERRWRAAERRNAGTAILLLAGDDPRGG